MPSHALRRKPTTPPGGLRPISSSSDGTPPPASHPSLSGTASASSLSRGGKNLCVFSEMAKSTELNNALKSWRPPSATTTRVNSSASSECSFEEAAEELELSPGARLSRIRVLEHVKKGRNIVEQVSCGIKDLEDSTARFSNVNSPNLQLYYEARKTQQHKPVHLNPGCGNFSSLVLGDDRIRMTSSFAQECARRTKLLAGLQSPVKLTRQQLVMDYQDATRLVGTAFVKEMEKLMRDKLMQRTTAGPFQLRKTFKYFDRNSTGTIDIHEFAAALSTLGLDFEEVQVTALFARYDADQCGEVNYQTFVAHLMEVDFYDLAKGEEGQHIRDLAAVEFMDRHDSIEEIEDVLRQRRSTLHDYRSGRLKMEKQKVEEARKIFSMIDRDGSGQINKDELGLLLLTLGRTVTEEQLEAGMQRLDLDDNQVISFDEFMLWYAESAESAEPPEQPRRNPRVDTRVSTLSDQS